MLQFYLKLLNQTGRMIFMPGLACVTRFRVGWQWSMPQHLLREEYRCMRVHMELAVLVVGATEIVVGAVDTERGKSGLGAVVLYLMS